MKILSVLVLLAVVSPVFADGPNDGIYSLIFQTDSHESEFAAIHQNGDVVVFIALDPDTSSSGEPTWSAAQGIRTGDLADLLFILNDEGLRFLLEFNDDLNATGTITECVPEPDVCDLPVGTVFDLIKVF